MNKRSRVQKGISWRQVGEQGVVIHPRRELMVGLTRTGYGWWETMASAEPGAGAVAPDEGFVQFFRGLGFFTDSPEPAAAPPEPPALPPEVSWLEPFRPLAFTASCGRVPAGGGPCAGNPHEGH